jgi:hypothetical protein
VLQLCTITNIVIQHLFLFLDPTQEFGRRNYDYQSIMVFSINFGLGLTSNKTWGCYKYKPFDLWTAQLFSFLSEILSMEWRPKREKRNVTLLWAVFSAPTSLSKINFSDKPYFHKLPICSKYLCCCFFYSYSLHFY